MLFAVPIFLCLESVTEMKVVVQGNQDIMPFLRKKYVETTKYKLSTYLIRENMEKGQTLLLNTITGEMVLLSRKEMESVENLLSEGKGTVDELIEHGFLVPTDCDEVKRVGQLRNILLRRKEVEERITHYNILPTTDCNARCFYCYESGISREHMTEETADLLVEFIATHSRKTPVTISWFGGEPTIGKERIDQICRGLREREIPYSSKMISNAYLFDENLIKHAKEVWHLENIQVTLDGTEDVYNRIKAYVYKSGNPYQRILHNIQLLLDQGIKVNIRLNMGRHNQEDLRHLIDELAQRFKGNQRLIVYVRLIMIGDTCDICLEHNAEDRKRLQEQYYKLKDILEENGWPQTERTLPVFQTFCCMADNPSSIQCAPNGILSKCEHYIFDHVVGNLRDGVTDMEEMKSWQEKQLFFGCEGCALYPSCNKLLKQCPSSKERCWTEDKRRRMEQIHHKMLEVYNKWLMANMRKQDTGQ